MLRKKHFKSILERARLLGALRKALGAFRAVKSSIRASAYPLERRLYSKAIALHPQSKRNFERMFSLCFARRGLDPLGAAADFSLHFDNYLKINPAGIFKWRKQAYSAFWMLNDHVGMQNFMQQYAETQSQLRRDGLHGMIDFLIADNIFLANYNVHAFLDVHVKAMALGWQPDQKIAILLRKDNVVCNPVMLGYWQPYIEVIRDETANAALWSMSEYLTSDLSYTAELQGRAVYIEHAKYQVQKQWEAEGRAPLMQLSSPDIEFGREQLAAFGIPRDAWFVSVHVRDAGCKLGSYKARDDSDSYRNADIDSYEAAIRSIRNRGGYVVRVGDPNMKPMAPMEGVVDYALSGRHSNRMDIFLFTQCRFFVGVASGPIMTSILFGVPTVITNFAPMSSRPHASNCLFIPKTLWLRNENRFATFHEVLSSDLSRIFSSQGFEQKDVRVVDNTPEELNDVVVEMLDRLDGSSAYSAQDELLQEKCSALYREHSGYGDLGRIGREFIRKYADRGLLN